MNAVIKDISRRLCSSFFILINRKNEAQKRNKNKFTIQQLIVKIYSAHTWFVPMSSLEWYYELSISIISITLPRRVPTTKNSLKLKGTCNQKGGRFNNNLRLVKVFIWKTQHFFLSFWQFKNVTLFNSFQDDNATYAVASVKSNFDRHSSHCHDWFSFDVFDNFRKYSFRTEKCWKLLLSNKKTLIWWIAYIQAIFFCFVCANIHKKTHWMKHRFFEINCRRNAFNCYIPSLNDVRNLKKKAKFN